jgi:hypothetical protein
MNNTISSAVRFWEKMQERVRKMEEEEAKLMASADKKTRAPIHTKTRVSSGFGKGMVRRDKWKEGMPRITQAACEVVHEYAQARAAAQGQYVGRKWYSDRAGISTATLNRCANEMMRGEIFLDPTDGLWKVATRQNEQETRTAAAFGERDKSPHGAPSQVALA